MDVVAQITNLMGTVPGVQFYTDPGAGINLPAAVLSLPTFDWSNYSQADPTDATFTLYVVVKADGYVISVIEPIMMQIVEALYSGTDLVVSHAVPGTFESGGTQLPAYVVTVEALL